MAEGARGADRTRPELFPDAIADCFGDQPVLARLIEADLSSNLVGVDQVLALERECGQSAACRPAASMSQ
ncbi:hypothetical protein [Streptomyces sp. NPDC006285]|uniref:hypothetical protein n=1 Tax=Streptomyces sp. NPDC006285 TaxID=3364742 RepID=UPI003692B01A